MIRSTWISMTAVLAVGVLAGCGDDTTATTSDATTSGTGGATSSSSSSSSSTGGSGGNGGSGGGAPDCGDGDVTPPEGCDDANAVAGDGCDAACVVEAGFSCTGMPSVCTTDCGDGVTAGDEECDDGNTDAGDGCDASCVIETVVCGNGLIDGADGCDDGNTNAGDGCDASCAVEPGYVCVDEPSVCTTECGDGIILGNEQCDDGDLSADDGCSPGCTVENGFVCNGEPSMCATDCGDGILAGLEECDDSNSTSGDGCDGVTCAVEDGYVCANIPSVCVGECGDNVIVAGEECDDGNTSAGDGCGATCLFEATCGNGTVEPGEECDDGGVMAGDGCDMACQLEAGTLCGDAVDVNALGTTLGNVTSYLGDTTGSLVVNVGAPSCSPGTTDVPSILHSYTTTARASLVIESLDIDGMLDDTVVWAYLDCQDRNPASELTCDDDSGLALYSQATTAIIPSGTSVFIAISGYAAVDVGPYSLQITEVQVLPDGAPCDPADPNQQCEIDSECEGLPGAETCQPPICGDGVIEVDEECDDGNTMDGDGCSSACIVEVTLESEPNDTSATANGPFSPDTGLIGATIGVIGDQDFFAINIPATADLRIETFDTSGPSTCAGAIDTVVELLAPDGTTSVITRDQGGVNNCSRIDSALEADAAARHLAPGIYFVRVEDYLNNGTIPGYTLYVTYNALCGDGVVEGAEECEPGGAIPCGATCDRVQACGDGFIDAPEQCDDGNTMDGDGCSSMCVFEPQLTESEPNNTFMTADYVLPSAIPAAITIVNDDDFFAVAVPGPASVLTATITAGVVNTCGSDTNPAPPAIDSEIQILGTSGTTSLATNDDISGTLNWCSSAQATGLAAGIYYVRAASSGTFCSACTFDYTLNITVN